VQCHTARRQLCLIVADGRIRNQCLRRNRAEACTRCGQTAIVAFRDGQQQAVCPRCRRRDRATFQPCRQCGRHGPVASRDEHGRPLGSCCYVTPARVCGGCGKLGPITATTSASPRCAACYQRPPRRCGVCGQPRLIVRKARQGKPDVCAVAPLTVASLLDMHLGTANTWAEASSGSWSHYLDDLLDDHDDPDHTLEDTR
jgi:hypothetical protein